METTGYVVEQYDMLLKWVPIVEAAGIDTRGVDLFSVYLMAGSIMKDPVVTERRAAMGNIAASAAYVFGSAYIEILRKMTPEEKAALKQRINSTRVGLHN